MASDKQRKTETNQGDTHAAPMVDDTGMSSGSVNDTAGSGQVAGAEGDAGSGPGAETGIIHGAMTGTGAAGMGGNPIIAGSGIAGGAMLPTEMDPKDAKTPTNDDLTPEYRGVQKGADQDSHDSNDRDVADMADIDRT